MTAGARRRSVQVAALIAGLILLVWLVLRPESQPPQTSSEPPLAVPAQAVADGSVLEAKPCHRGVSQPFTPTRITVPGVTRNTRVLALPRDAANVPQAPPISNEGKTLFAWDRPTTKPGEPKGNVLLNAHTWPDGTALGNKLLAGLRVGGRIVVHGEAGGKPQTLCYRVTKKDVIVASDGSWEYYERNGPPQIALIVCSPPRLGPGNWLHRTIWYASPISS